jgi:hypothetical protein
VAENHLEALGREQVLHGPRVATLCRKEGYSGEPVGSGVAGWSILQHISKQLALRRQKGPVSWESPGTNLELQVATVREQFAAPKV